MKVPVLIRSVCLTAALVAVSACSFPGVYKLDIPQGNIITQDNVNQLRPGMSKRQVRFLMGTPLLVDSFNEDRWDYFYSLRNNSADYSRERLTMFFVNDRLHHMQGNFRPTATTAVADAGDATNYDMIPAKAATPRAESAPPMGTRPVIPPPDTPAEVYPVPPTDVQEVPAVDAPPAQ